MASETPRMAFHGSQQTCYADWSRAVLTFYPYNPTYKRVGESIHVFDGDTKVAEFEFNTGMGYITHAVGHDISEVGKLPNYQPFEVDSLIKSG